MRKGLKSLLIMGLTFTFIFASIYCCCIPDLGAAEANDDVPECHQTTSEKNMPQEPQSQECCCPHILSLTVEKSGPAFEIVKPDINFVHEVLPRYISFIPELTAYHSPPDIQADSIPLYLKNSNLRL